MGEENANIVLVRMDKLTAIMCNGNRRQFCEITGISYNTINGWFHRNGKPGTDAIAQICEKTGCSADWLLLGREPVFFADKTPATAASPDIQTDLVRLFETMMANSLLSAEALAPRADAEEHLRMVFDKIDKVREMKERFEGKASDRSQAHPSEHEKGRENTHQQK